MTNQKTEELNYIIGNSLIVADTDCISSFLVSSGKMLLFEFAEKIIVPMQVDSELRRPGSSRKGIKARYESLKSQHKIEVYDGSATDAEFSNKYRSYISTPRPIGSGEAAALTYAEKYNAVIASNNMRDVAEYVQQLHLRQLTTARIILIAEHLSRITTFEAANQWDDMTRKGIQLPKGLSFVEFKNTAEAQQITKELDEYIYEKNTNK